MNGKTLLLWLSALAFGCADSTPPSVGGESNWLETCNSNGDCAVGSCWCGVCTGACENADSCEERGGGECFDESFPGIASCRPRERLCLESCTDDGDCAKGQVCAEGACIARAVHGEVAEEDPGDPEPAPNDGRPVDGTTPTDDAMAGDDDAMADDDDAMADDDDAMADDDDAMADDDLPETDDDAPPPDDCASELPATSQVPMLTHEQYDRTVRDLLGVTALDEIGGSPPSALLAPEHSGNLTEADWTAYQAAATAIARKVMTTPELRPNFLGCTPTEDDSDCLRTTIVDFGRRAFRRPLSAAEVDSFLEFAGSSEIEETPEQDAEATLAGFLISPSFLLRAELSESPDADGHYVLSSHEVAARLSFMLWGSLPDETLDLAADSGELETEDGIRVQAERMLSDPKARDVVLGFHRAYLALEGNTRWEAVSRDTTLFPEFSSDLMPALKLETERFIEHVVLQERGTFGDLFSSNVVFVTAATAPLYGLPSTGTGEELVVAQLPAGERPGVLTRAGFLTAYSHEDRTAPILRGAFILENVLGVDTAPLEDNIATPLPADPGLDTNRKRVDAQTAGSTCVGCHGDLINPLGFALESYDAIGRWQTTEAETGAAIDTEVDVTIDGESVHVSNALELMWALANSQSARNKYARDWVDFAYGRNGFPVDPCAVETFQEDMSDAGYQIVNMIVDLTLTDSFRLRALEVD